MEPPSRRTADGDGRMSHPTRRRAAGPVPPVDIPLCGPPVRGTARVIHRPLAPRDARTSPTGSLVRVYRFLLTPRWLAAAAVTVAAAVVMVLLGNWQMDRYRERSAVNDRIDAAESAAPVPLTSVLTAPTAPGTAGPSPGRAKAWTKVTMTGRYDPAHEIQARGRTVDRAVGFEIVTPLVLADGTAVLVDRGWIPPAPGGAVAAPSVPPAPAGTVTVVGRIHLSESRPAPL